MSEVIAWIIAVVALLAALYYRAKSIYYKEVAKRLMNDVIKQL
jgi:hypothetical protein